ncbi:hypothetical protein TNCV_3565931 [Trichonephila clavipes]|nr:hypothetical protein TNCV_3565931 [Trichonephila clavipes]
MINIHIQGVADFDRPIRGLAVGNMWTTNHQSPWGRKTRSNVENPENRSHRMDGEQNNGRIWNAVVRLNKPARIQIFHFRSCCKKVQATAYHNVWFLHDGEPEHLSIAILHLSHAMYPERCIGRCRPITWPLRSPGLNPLNFYFYGT